MSFNYKSVSFFSSVFAITISSINPASAGGCLSCCGDIEEKKPLVIQKREIEEGQNSSKPLNKSKGEKKREIVRSIEQKKSSSSSSSSPISFKKDPSSSIPTLTSAALLGVVANNVLHSGISKNTNSTNAGSKGYKSSSSSDSSDSSDSSS